MNENLLIPEEQLPGVLVKLAIAREADAENRTTSLNDLAAKHGITRKTLYSIRKAAQQGPEFLIRNQETRPGPKPGIHQKALAWALAFKEAHPKAKLTVIREKLREAKLGCGMPSYFQLRQSFKRDFDELIRMMEAGYREFYNSQVIKLRRSYGFPNEVWEIDATDTNCYSYDLETGRLIRPWMLSVIDGYSRVVIYSMVFKKEPTADDLVEFLLRAFLAKGRTEHPFMGIPVSIVPDQHAIFKSAVMKEAMLKLGVILDFAPVNVPQGKAIIERWFRTVKDGLFASFVSYAEKSNAMGKAKTAAIPYPLMQKLVDEWIVKYHLREHSTLGTTPWEKFHDGLASAHGICVSEKDVRLALRVRVQKTIHEDGIELEDGRHYVAPEIVGLLGKTVIVLKPLTIGTAPIHAYYRGKRLCELKASEADSALSRKVADARMERLDVLREVRRDLRKAIKLTNGVSIPGVDPSKVRKSVGKKTKPRKGTIPSQRRRKIPDMIKEQDA